MAKLKVGDGTADGVTQGPLINMEGGRESRAAARRTRSAKARKIVAGGKRHALGGTFFEPTVLRDATPNMAVGATKKSSGPSRRSSASTTEADAIRIANDTEYGLAAYFYARDLGRVMRVAEALEYGILGINEGIISTEVAPFGGMKESGIGREGSKYGIEDYLEIKYLALGGLGA